jgi:hypothetical protein
MGNLRMSCGLVTVVGAKGPPVFDPLIGSNMGRPLLRMLSRCDWPFGPVVITT